MGNILDIETAALDQLESRGITLKEFNSPRRLTLYGDSFKIPPHSEEDWFLIYVRRIEKGRKSSEIAKIAKEAYALLRSRQALSEYSGESKLEILRREDRESTDGIYQAAEREYDERTAAR